MTRLEAAEMRFLRNVKGYTRLVKVKSAVIRKELKISGIQDVFTKRAFSYDAPVSVINIHCAFFFFFRNGGEGGGFLLVFFQDLCVCVSVYVRMCMYTRVVAIK